MSTLPLLEVNHNIDGQLSSLLKAPPIPDSACVRRPTFSTLTQYPGFNYLEYDVLLGRGRSCYDAASSRVVSLKLSDSLKWVQFQRLPSSLSPTYSTQQNLPSPSLLSSARTIHYDEEQKQLASCVSHVHSFGLVWMLNPCRLVSDCCNELISYPSPNVYLPHQDQHQVSFLRSGVHFTTLNTHFEIGEELFTVEMENPLSAEGRKVHEDEREVWLRLRSLSRGTGILGRLAGPMVKWLQVQFFKELGESMKSAVVSMHASK